MKISIVIIVRNEEDRIKSCLDSIVNQRTDNSFEVVIIDGDSEDNTVKIVQSYLTKYTYIRLIQCNRYGYSYQRNIGAKNAEGEYILYLSGDTVLSKNLVSKYLKCIDKYDIIQGSIINIDKGNLFGRVMKNAYRVIYSEHLASISENFSTVNVCIKKELVLARPFDENIMSLEDKEWCQFYEEKVKYVRLVGGAVYHQVHENFREYGKKIYNEAYALGHIIKKSECNREKLNFFNWYGYMKIIISIFVISLLIGIVACIFFNSFVILAISLLPVMLFKFFYVLFMLKNIKNNKEKAQCYGLSYFLFDYVFWGMIRSLIKNSFEKGNGNL